ncbi:hypothetical protein GVAV_001213 [Gurleya vavrai]
MKEDLNDLSKNIKNDSKNNILTHQNSENKAIIKKNSLNDVNKESNQKQNINEDIVNYKEEEVKNKKEEDLNYNEKSKNNKDFKINEEDLKNDKNFNNNQCKIIQKELNEIYKENNINCQAHHYFENNEDCQNFIKKIKSSFDFFFDLCRINSSFDQVFIPHQSEMEINKATETLLLQYVNTLKYYEFIELLEDRQIKIEELSSSILITIIEELKNAFIFFKEKEKNDEYLHKCIKMEGNVRFIIRKKIYEKMQANNILLLKDKEFNELLCILNETDIIKVKLRYLKLKKITLLGQKKAFISNFDFLVMQAVKQEFNLYFKMFEKELKIYLKELENGIFLENLFEKFVVSFVSVILEKMNRTDIIKKRENFMNKIKDFDTENLYKKSKVDNLNNDEINYLINCMLNKSILKFLTDSETNNVSYDETFEL